ncbi:hypothetical protein DH2020_034973 [Rehmannia glutinosa]|uniref:Uncharacterized protein n=1 Tax=Rehmannia glutinosa TaxID=99300 RepID=A0ABR0V8F8_REHGL
MSDTRLEEIAAHDLMRVKKALVLDKRLGSGRPLTPKFANQLLEVRHKGARDFKNSPIFDRHVVQKAAEFEVLGFYKCRPPRKFGGFKPDFDPSKLDPELDGNGEKSSLEEVEEEDLGGHEFGFLLQDPNPANEEVPPQGRGGR